MGLPMENIHDPTVVSSGPATSHGAANGKAQDKVALMDLMEEKTRVEEELKALGSVLDSHNVNMNTPLTTFDGYPRDDLDIAQIRTTRARIIHLRNDYKNLMSRIESGLHEYHLSHQASVAASSPSTAHTAASSSSSQQQVATAVGDRTLIETPFAKVNSVEQGSPAAEAGLMAGDWIRRFGDVNWMNHEKLTKVAETVRTSQGRSVIVKVLRAGETRENDQELSLSLIPRVGWGGRGSLGCHLLPV